MSTDLARELQALDKMKTFYPEKTSQPPKASLPSTTALVQFLRPFIKSRWKSVLLILSISTLTAIYNAAFAFGLKFLIDEAILQKNQETLILGGTVMAAFCFAIAVSGVFADYHFSKVASGILSDIRKTLFDRILSLPARTSNEQQSRGEILSRFSGDIQSLETAFIGFIPWLYIPIAETVLSLFVLSYLDFELSLLALSAIALTLLVPRAFALKAIAQSHDKRLQEGYTLSALEDSLRARPMIKAYGLSSWATTWFGRYDIRLRRSTEKFLFSAASVERSAHVGNISIHLVVLGVGAWWAFQGKISLGSLIAFQTLFVTLTYAVTWATQYLPMAAQAESSCRNFLELLSACEKQAEAERPGASLKRIQHVIQLQEVSYQHPGSDHGVFKLNLNIEVGKITGIVGLSGSGKSTLIGLLLRFFSPTQGKILIDGRNILDFSPETVRSRIGVVLQEALVMNMSIRENILLGNFEASDDELHRACEQAQILDFICSLPNGFSTLLSENGSTLSGGQRQRIALARALIRDPDILIFDEATAAIDVQTSKRIFDSLKSSQHQRAMVIVTHRLSEVEFADKICVLAKGVIEERGCHKELLSREDSLYRELWQARDTQNDSKVQIH